MGRKQTIERLLVVWAVIGLGSCFFWARYREDRQVYHLKNGLTVEVLPVEPSDVAEVLQMSRWKLHITMPQGASLFKSIVEVRRGGVPTPLHQGLPGVKGHGDYAVFTEVPPSQREFDMKIVLYSPKGSINHDSHIMAWVKCWATPSLQSVENPFSDATGGYNIYANPAPQGDDSFILLDAPTAIPNAAGDAFSFVRGDGRKNAELVLKIAPADSAEPSLFTHGK